MKICIVIEEIKGGWLIGGSYEGQGNGDLEQAAAATEKQIPARIKDIIAPLFAEVKT